MLPPVSLKIFQGELELKPLPVKEPGSIWEEPLFTRSAVLGGTTIGGTTAEAGRGLGAATAGAVTASWITLGIAAVTEAAAGFGGGAAAEIVS